MKDTKKVKAKKSSNPVEETKKYRNFPKLTLQSAMVLPQKIQDEMGGNPMKRLLLADALDISPSSSNFRELLSSAYKYGLTEGTEKADFISLTETGADATHPTDPTSRLRALRRAALEPEVFGRFLKDFANKKLPSSEMLPKILMSQYGVPPDLAMECATNISANGRHVDIVRDISGSPHILLDSDPAGAAATSSQSEFQTMRLKQDETPTSAPPEAPKPATPSIPAAPSVGGPKPIFVGHGKNRAPLQQLQQLLSSFQIPHKVVVNEPNLGRPIPQKVRDTIEECGSAILIFTRDEKFFDADGKELWRPSENVVHELGATSYVYGDRIVIFKEKGIYFPTNFQSIGYIEFDSDDLIARTADLLKELIGFGLVKITPTV